MRQRQCKIFFAPCRWTVVHLEMFHLEDQTVAYQCDVAELVLKKSPHREKSWLLVGQERFFLSFLARDCACLLRLLVRSPWLTFLW